jgi:magnesium chelatase subunit D
MRVRRVRQNATTTTLFVVDASGSAALHRLAEAKGAVELLLAECYVRRDRVALVAFRGQQADVLLPPTRSLVRAKRSLAGLRGGGGTPLASAIDHAGALAGSLQRQGDSVIMVFLTDGRANIARDGSPGRELAEAQALESARQLAQVSAAVLLVDTSPRPQAQARTLASAMAATYLPLPHADAPALSGLVRTAGSLPVGGRRAA